MLDRLDDGDDWDGCDECPADDEGGAEGVTFLGTGAETLGRASICCCGRSTGADEGGELKERVAGAELFTAGEPV